MRKTNIGGFLAYVIGPYLMEDIIVQLTQGFPYAVACVQDFSARVCLIIPEIASEECDSTRLDQLQVLLGNETALPVAD